MSQTNLLDEKEVRSRLASYENSNITDELYTFGQMLLRDAIDRIAKSDASAFGIAAYCGGLIAVIVSSCAAWRSSFDPWTVYLIAFALLITAVSGAVAIYSTSPFATEWFSANEWMPKECFSGTDRLKRFYVLALWGVVNDHQANFRRRSRLLRMARWMLVIVALELFVAFLNFVWRHTTL